MSESSAKETRRQFLTKSWRRGVLEIAVILSGLGGLVVFVEWILGTAG